MTIEELKQHKCPTCGWSEISDEIIALVEAVNRAPLKGRTMAGVLEYLDGLEVARDAFNAKLETLP